MSTDVKRFPSCDEIAMMETSKVPTPLQLVDLLERLQPIIPTVVRIPNAALLVAQLAAVIFSALGKPPARAFEAGASWANEALARAPVSIDRALRILSSEVVVTTITGLGRATLRTESQPKTLQAIDLLSNAFNALADEGSAGGN